MFGCQLRSCIFEPQKQQSKNTAGQNRNLELPRFTLDFLTMWNDVGTQSTNLVLNNSSPSVQCSSTNSLTCLSTSLSLSFSNALFLFPVSIITHTPLPFILSLFLSCPLYWSEEARVGAGLLCTVTKHRPWPAGPCRKKQADTHPEKKHFLIHRHICYPETMIYNYSTQVQ